MRRGADQAVITDISFDPTNTFVSVCSDKSTVHLFHVDESKSENSNAKSKLAGLSSVFGYFGSSWSTCQMKIEDTHAKCACMNGKLFVITKMGQYYLGKIPEDGSTSIEVEQKIDCIAQSRTQQQ